MNLLLTLALLTQACAGAAPPAALPLLNPDHGTSCQGQYIPADTAVVRVGPACAGFHTPSFTYASTRTPGIFCDTQGNLNLRIPLNSVFKQRLPTTGSACTSGTFRFPVYRVEPADLSAAQSYACSGTPTPVGYEVARPARPTDGSCGPYTVTLVPQPVEVYVQGETIPVETNPDGSITFDGVTVAPPPASYSVEPEPCH